MALTSPREARMHAMMTGDKESSGSGTQVCRPHVLQPTQEPSGAGSTQEAISTGSPLDVVTHPGNTNTVEYVMDDITIHQLDLSGLSPRTFNADVKQNVGPACIRDVGMKKTDHAGAIVAETPVAPPDNIISNVSPGIVVADTIQD